MLDASVAAAWFVPGQETASAAQLLADAPSHVFEAPHFFQVEIRNVFRSAERRGNMREIDTARSLSVLAAFNISTAAAPSPRQCDEILSLARQENLSVYDGIYLWHATRTGATLATRDAALITASGRVRSLVLDLRQ